jgi:enoyl-CoA hydratase/carnithine racemase
VRTTQIAYEVRDHVATVTLDRPDRLNAFTNVMLHELVEAFDEVDADDEVRAVVVTGRGRAFCAGADLSAGGATFSEGGSDIVTGSGLTRDGGGVVALRIFQCLKPVIAAVNGAAVGVGTTMTLPMDFRLASQSARFGLVFTRRGIVPEACSSWFLPRMVGMQQAAEWIYTGRVFPADEALAGGLLRSVHLPDDLLPAAYALAAEIVDNAAPVSVALSRQMMWRMLGADHPMAAHRAESRGIQERGASADAREGVTSFLEKRAAVFPGRVGPDLPDVFPGWVEPEFS